MVNVPWSQDKLDIALAMCAAGSSSRQIAEHLGVTRNAVIGKLGRVGAKLKRPETYKMPKEERVKKTRQRQSQAIKHYHKTKRLGRPPKIKPEPIVIITLDDPPAEERIPIAKLKSHHCVWICGDPGTPGFGYCGRDKVKGSYCPTHYQRSKREYTRAKVHHRPTQSKYSGQYR